MNSLPTEKTNGAVQQNPSEEESSEGESSKEGVETKDATKNPKHFTLKDEEHKEESTLKNENHIEVVNSPPTKKRKNKKKGKKVCQ